MSQAAKCRLKVSRLLDPMGSSPIISPAWWIGGLTRFGRAGMTRPIQRRRLSILHRDTPIQQIPFGNYLNATCIKVLSGP
jgi:hypothetical protein